MRTFSELDLKILDTAQSLFLTQGLLNTEMKDIANRLDCSRSTLYRHFPSKGDILFVLAQRSLDMIADAVRIPEGKRFASGYEAFEWQINAMVRALILNIDAVSFLRDFDCLYTGDFPDIPQAEVYRDSIINSDGAKALKESFFQGMEDKSIRRSDTPELMVLTVIHSCIALAQRILPREQHYIIEYGYGRELLRCQVNLILSALRNT